MINFIKQNALITIMVIMFIAGVVYLKSDSHNPFLGATLCTFGIGLWIIVQIVSAIQHSFWKALFIAASAILFIIGMSKGLGWI